MSSWRHWVCFIGVASSVSACTWARRASLDAVDPELRAKGESLARAQDSQGAFRLGSYLVSEPQLARQGADEQGALARDDEPRPVEQHRLDLGLSDDGRQWAIGCTSQRRRSASMDYAAVLDENRDEIAVECTLSPTAGLDGRQGWRFVTEAELGHNFAGKLMQDGSDRALTVEVVMWVERFGRVTRHLPDPIAQVRDGRQAIAAMVLGQPEQAWLASEIDPDLAEVSLSALLALRFLPLGLEG